MKQFRLKADVIFNADDTGHAIKQLRKHLKQLAKGEAADALVHMTGDISIQEHVEIPSHSTFVESMHNVLENRSHFSTQCPKCKWIYELDDTPINPGDVLTCPECEYRWRVSKLHRVNS